MALKPRLLFIVKRRCTYWGPDKQECVTALSSGLTCSVGFVVDMLQRHGITADIIDVNDNNDIDAAVTLYKPTHVIIEAFWVVPSKFDVLKPLHPTVRWIVRNHSNMPFLASEGIATQWVIGYLSRGIEVMSNSPNALADLQGVAVACGLPESLLTYGPNVYPDSGSAAISIASPPFPASGPVKIGCYGALRPLKNQLAQAIAALLFADAIGRPIEFHINGTRVEGEGGQSLKNIVNLFASASPKAGTLVQDAWLPHVGFIALQATMDIAMQVSFSETFNIVSADAVMSAVPLVGSPDIPWLGGYGQADPTSVNSIASLMLAIWNSSPRELYLRLNQQRRDLVAYVAESTAVWVSRFR
jgi:hypothetical protein